MHAARAQGGSWPASGQGLRGPCTSCLCMPCFTLSRLKPRHCTIYSVETLYSGVWRTRGCNSGCSLQASGICAASARPIGRRRRRTFRTHARWGGSACILLRLCPPSLALPLPEPPAALPGRDTPCPLCLTARAVLASCGQLRDGAVAWGGGVCLGRLPACDATGRTLPSVGGRRLRSAFS